MSVKRVAALICALVLLCTLAPAALAAQEDTVYIRKHVSLLYDNSGSMSMDLGNADNLKWCYGSYAAQAFAALLNDMDTLTVTFMNSQEGDRLRDSVTGKLPLDMAADRPAQVSELLKETSWARGSTPVQSIDDALQVLLDKGLKADSQMDGTESFRAEQYWLVLTTDGVFDYSEPGVGNGENLSREEVENKLAQILEQYSNLQLVYFGIGTKEDDSDYKAVNFNRSDKLMAYPNFTAVYAEDQEKIVSTMQELSNRISGRYAVNSGVKVEDATVTMTISGESSAVRNIGILAQNTGATLKSARMKDGTPRRIVRSARLEYPTNGGKYDEMPAGTQGGYSAMVSSEEGKIPAGTVVLTFDQPVNAADLTLMFEPAIYVSLQLQRRDDRGQWTDVPYGSKVAAGDTLRLRYDICEDGTGEPLDSGRLPGRTVADIRLDGEVLRVGSSFVVKEGISVINATVSMMDGAYSVTASRTIRGMKYSEFDVTSSGPLSFSQEELWENTTQHIEFSLSFDGRSATKTQLEAFKVDGGGLNGTTQYLENGVIRFTPCDQTAKAGSTYTVSVVCEDKAVGSETVTVIANPSTYSAQAGEPLSIYDNKVDGNTKGVLFYVTAHTDEGDVPVTLEESFLFSAQARSSTGQILGGTLMFLADGQIQFVPGGAGAAPGDYDVSLSLGDQILATAKVTVLRYDAQYSVEALTPDPVEVDRFDLAGNQTAVNFIVYADGVPCTADQLGGMLGNMIVAYSNASQSVMEMELSVAQHNGKAVVRVRPASAADNPVVGFLHKTLIAWGAVPKGDLSVILTVQAVKGASASAVLQSVSSTFEDILYKVLFIAILVVALLILWIVFCNLKMPRIKRGAMYYYELIPDGGRQYFVMRQSVVKVRGGLFLRLWPSPQTLNLEGLTFSAGSGGSRRLGGSYSPEVVLHGYCDELSRFYNASTDGNILLFLAELRQGGTNPEIMDIFNVQGLIPPVPIVTAYDAPADNREFTQPVMLYDNGFLVRMNEDESLRMWIFRPWQG